MDEAAHEKVSFDDEPLILVDEQDNEIGYRSKGDCHAGHGTLHRAFSIFLFDGRGRVLLQQRSASKPLWPLYWSNSCCSHPRRGERMEQALHRRLREELGLDAPLEFVYKFIYQADFDDVGAEHELCHVYIGAAGGAVRVHPEEIADWKWVPIDEVTRELSNSPELYTPWFKMEWEALMEKCPDRIRKLKQEAARA
ncbi:MAG: isopentenyl-diphosphate Delta-isomerase [Wenzhouxiangellaceae bacterium]